MIEHIPIGIDRTAELAVGNIDAMALAINAGLHIARDEPGNLYWYDNGIYRPGGEDAVKEMYKKILIDRYRRSEWKPRMGNSIIECLLQDAPSVQLVPDLWRINLKNGLYHWGGEIFKPHDINYRTLIQIPIEYDPSASCPYWDGFLEDVLPGGEWLLIEIVGLCMIPLTDLQKCIVLVGTGSNGKSKYLNGLVSAVGKQNVCNVDLHRLSNPNDRFSRANLVGKLVNVFADLSAKRIDDTSNLKVLTGQDAINIEYKGKNPFDYYTFARLVFSCNEVVKSDDDTDGYKRRFIHIPFIKKFALDPAKGREIDEKLSSPRELSGLFNKIAARLNSIADEGFSMTPAIAAIVDDWCPLHPKVKEWIESNVVEDEKGVIPSSLFYYYYEDNCSFDAPFSRQKTIRSMKNVFPGIKCHVPLMVNGHQVRCYRGVRMRDEQVQRELIMAIAGNKEDYNVGF